MKCPSPSSGPGAAAAPPPRGPGSGGRAAPGPRRHRLLARLFVRPEGAGPRGRGRGAGGGDWERGREREAGGERGEAVAVAGGLGAAAAPVSAGRCPPGSGSILRPRRGEAEAGARLPRGRVRRGPGREWSYSPRAASGPPSRRGEASRSARRGPRFVAARPRCPPPRGAAGGPDTTPMAAAPGPAWSGAAAPPRLRSSKERCAGLERGERLGAAGVG